MSHMSALFETILVLGALITIPALICWHIVEWVIRTVRPRSSCDIPKWKLPPHLKALADEMDIERFTNGTTTLKEYRTSLPSRSNSPGPT